MNDPESISDILQRARDCTVCEQYLEHGVRPVLSVSSKSKIAIIGQAPGAKVHASGKPWDDASGKRLRAWLGVTEDEFYHADHFAILPMGFCYPGKGKSGDLPPRPECAPLWHQQILERMPKIELVLLIGQYAQRYYLGDRSAKSLTENVVAYRRFLPDYMPMPHPSPRNVRWFKQHPWFEEDVVPLLKEMVDQAIRK